MRNIVQKQLHTSENPCENHSEKKKFAICILVRNRVRKILTKHLHPGEKPCGTHCDKIFAYW